MTLPQQHEQSGAKFNNAVKNKKISPTRALNFHRTFPTNPAGRISGDYSQYWHLSPVYSGRQAQRGWLPAVTLQVPPLWQKRSHTVWLQRGPVKPRAQLQVGRPVQNRASYFMVKINTDQNNNQHFINTDLL